MAEAAAPESEDRGPDVLLDVPTLKVDEIKLNVEQLDAKVALHAQLDRLVSIDVGATVGIGKVELDIKGVEAQALLKVRLKQVYAILARALETIDRNPDLVKKLLEPIGAAAEAIGRETGHAVGEIGTQTGRALGPGGPLSETVREVGGTAKEALSPEGVGGRTLRDVGEAAAGVTAPQGPVSESVKGVSEGLGHAVQGQTHETEQERRHYEEQGRHHEHYPEPDKKESA